jgi:hypothetical protein
MSLSPCCPYHPAEVSCRIGQPAPCHAAFAPKQGARPPEGKKISEIALALGFPKNSGQNRTHAALVKAGVAKSRESEK